MEVVEREFTESMKINIVMGFSVLLLSGALIGPVMKTAPENQRQLFHLWTLVSSCCFFASTLILGITMKRLLFIDGELEFQETAHHRIRYFGCLAAAMATGIGFFSIGIYVVDLLVYIGLYWAAYIIFPITCFFAVWSPPILMPSPTPTPESLESLDQYV